MIEYTEREFLEYQKEKLKRLKIMIENNAINEDELDRIKFKMINSGFINENLELIPPYKER